MSTAPCVSASGDVSIISQKRLKPVIPFWYCSTKEIIRRTGLRKMPI